jgi:CheY-like chemotaxis protein
MTCTSSLAGTRFALTLPCKRPIGPIRAVSSSGPVTAAQVVPEPIDPDAVVAVQAQLRSLHSGRAAESRISTRYSSTPDTQTTSPALGSVAGARVLVVDDSEANRRFASFAARKLGCTVTTACDGDEVVAAVASAAAAGTPYDVVLMDLVMVRAALLLLSVGVLVVCLTVADAPPPHAGAHERGHGARCPARRGLQAAARCGRHSERDTRGRGALRDTGVRGHAREAVPAGTDARAAGECHVPGGVIVIALDAAAAPEAL